MAAAGALSHLAKHTVGALPILVRSAESDREANVRHRALWALEEMGPAAAPARRAIERLLRDPDRDVQRFAGRALKAISIRVKNCERESSECPRKQQGGRS